MCYGKMKPIILLALFFFLCANLAQCRGLSHPISNQSKPTKKRDFGVLENSVKTNPLDRNFHQSTPASIKRKAVMKKKRRNVEYIEQPLWCFPGILTPWVPSGKCEKYCKALHQDPVCIDYNCWCTSEVDEFNCILAEDGMNFGLLWCFPYICMGNIKIAQNSYLIW